MAKRIRQEVVVQAEGNLDKGKRSSNIQLFNEDGTPFSGGDGPALPALATAAELQAGTVTEPRMVSPKLIHDEIQRQIAAIPPA